MTRYPFDLIGKTKFYMYRPPNIVLVSFSTRQTCLCQKHQNLSLKLNALKNLKIVNTTNPDQFVRSDTNIEASLKNVNVKTINYREWKNVKVENE